MHYGGWCLWRRSQLEWIRCLHNGCLLGLHSRTGTHPPLPKSVATCVPPFTIATGRKSVESQLLLYAFFLRASIAAWRAARSCLFMLRPTAFSTSSEQRNFG
jgi:hypothetical protein